jgi:hypothetical protein
MSSFILAAPAVSSDLFSYAGSSEEQVCHLFSCFYWCLVVRAARAAFWPRGSECHSPDLALSRA